MKAVLLVLCSFVCASAAFAESVESILTRMDQAAPSFRGVTAKITVVNFTAILGDTTTERGTLTMQRPKASDTRAIIDFSALPENARVISFQDGAIKIYYPNTQATQQYPARDYAEALNQILLLGFGSSGKDLQANYTIRAQGSEIIAGKATTKLQLIPKDPQLRDKLSQVELWIPADAAYPLQQKFSEAKASGNYRQVLYSDVELNPKMSGLLEFKVPAKTKKKKAN